MADLINSIKLSSGTVVTLPIFPPIYSASADENNYLKASRGGTVFAHFRGGNLFYQMLDDADSLELLNILYGKSYTSFEYEVYTPHQLNTASLLFWLYDAGRGYYRLTIPDIISEHSTATNAVIDIRNSFGNSMSMFYNSESYYDGEDHSYYDRCEQVKTAWYPAYAMNMRTGPIYTIDFAANNGSNSFARSITLQDLTANIAAYIAAHPDADIEITAFDPINNTDPYIVDDPSTFGGGGGSGDDPDAIEKMPIPDLPSLSAVDTGLVTLYTATNAQLQSLGGYLWSSLWDIETNFKKLFSDPMNCLVGLSIVPVTPSAGGAVNVKFGNITTNIALNVLASQYVEVDCGSVSIREYVGSFLDYSPYVNISIYLPYVGYRELSPDDVMNDTIHVVYHVDVLSGGCCAMIETGKKGLLYSFNGSCITNVPITAINYSGAIQNAVSAVGAGLTTVAGIATGTAPLTAVGATQMLQSASNTAMNSKPTIQRSGAMGGAAGLMSCQKPFLVITRPRMSVPDKLNKFVGLTTNVTMKLSQVKGFTQVEYVHLSGIAATEDEKQELMTLLRQGVIF